MKFKVMGLKQKDNKTGEVQLEAKDGLTIYTSQIFLNVPIAELDRYYFGQEFELVAAREEAAQ